MTMKNAVSWIAALLLTAAAASAPATADTQVVLYSANDDTVNKLVADGFKKETGITVNVVSTGSGVLFRRVASESANPQGDVVWGVSSALLKQNTKFFQPYAAKGRDAVPAEYRDPNNLWIGTNLQIVTINQNTRAIDAVSGPKTWQDLLDPKWKGKIAYTDPANSGFSYAAATVLLPTGVRATPAGTSFLRWLPIQGCSTGRPSSSTATAAVSIRWASRSNTPATCGRITEHRSR